MAPTFTTHTVQVLRDVRTGARFSSDGDLLWLLTGCCEASAKGTDGSPTGVACRACYRPLSADYGMAWTLGEFQADYPRWTTGRITAAEAEVAAMRVLAEVRRVYP